MNAARRLGEALHISKSSRNLILRAESSAKIGETVRDRHGKVIGTVFDVFGPISSPFIAVRPKTENSEKLIGEELYLKNS